MAKKLSRSLWKRPLWKRQSSAVLGVAALALLAGCASAPAPGLPGTPGSTAEPRPAEEIWYPRFPEQSTLFFTIHPTPEIRVSLARIANDRRLRTVLARTETVYGALTVGADGQISYSVAAPGRYPVGLARFGLGLSRAWKKTGSNRWITRDGNTELSLRGRDLALAGTAPLSGTFLALESQRSFALPDGVVEDLAGAELFVYLEDFPVDLAATITRVRLPLETAWLTARESEDGHWLMMRARFVLEEPRGVKVFSLGLKLMLTHFMREAHVDDLGERLKRISVETAGSEVTVEGLMLRPQELERLVVSIAGTEEA